jgi:FlaA1/EpsC-like NDP-sugar epimerase
MLKHYPPYKFILAIIDLFSLLIAYFLTMISERMNVDTLFDIRLSFFIAVVLFSILALFTFQYYQLYKQHIFLTKAAQFILLFKAMLINGTVVIVVLYFINHSGFLGIGRFTILLWILFSFCMLVVCRIVCLGFLPKPGL